MTAGAAALLAVAVDDRPERTSHLVADGAAEAAAGRPYVTRFFSHHPSLKSMPRFESLPLAYFVAALTAEPGTTCVAQRSGNISLRVNRPDAVNEKASKRSVMLPGSA